MVSKWIRLLKSKIRSLDGSGSSEDPYKISKAEDLLLMREDLDACYELVDDINLENISNSNKRLGFKPIGNINRQFTGVFNGNNNRIKNITTRFQNTNIIKSFIFYLPCGLFSYNIGTIRDLNICNSKVVGRRCVGGIVGINRGDIINVSFEGSVYGDRRVGGIVGSNSGRLHNSYSLGSVLADKNKGSLVGINRGDVQDSWSCTTVSKGNGEIDGDQDNCPENTGEYQRSRFCDTKLKSKDVEIKLFNIRIIYDLNKKLLKITTKKGIEYTSKNVNPCNIQYLVDMYSDSVVSISEKFMSKVITSST